MAGLRVAAGQLGPGDDDIERNVDRIIALMREAKDERAGIVCFPELATTTYFPPTFEAGFEKYFLTVDSEPVRRVRYEARELGLCVILPLAEADAAYRYNSALFIDSSGSVAGKYRKAHLPGSWREGRDRPSAFEKEYFTPGTSVEVFKHGWLRFGMQICYDLYFPEGYRALALQDCHLVFHPANVSAPSTTTPSADAQRNDEVMTFVPRTRALENACYVVFVNKAGLERGIRYLGQSKIVAPVGGKVLAMAESDGDELITAEVSLDEVNVGRRRIPFWRDRVELRPPTG